MLIRKLQKLARLLLKGPHQAAEKLVGCTHEQLLAHLAFPGQFFLAYRTHPREFNLKNVAEQRTAFHYTNLYARPKTITANSRHAKSFLSPLRPAPLPAASSRAARIAQV